MSRHLPAACAAMVITSVGTRAVSAAEPEPSERAAPAAPEAAPEAARPWAVVLDVGLASVSVTNVAGASGALGGLGAVGGLGGLGPVLGAGVERQVFERGWLMLDARGSYARASDDWGGQARSFGLGGALGLRHALTSPEVVELSWYGVLEGGYAQSSFAGVEAASGQAGVGAGLVLDKALTEWFGLRLRTGLFRVGYTRSVTSPPDAAGDVAQSFVATLSLEPHFALRFAF